MANRFIEHHLGMHVGNFFGKKENYKSNCGYPMRQRFVEIQVGFPFTANTVGVLR